MSGGGHLAERVTENRRAARRGASAVAAVLVALALGLFVRPAVAQAAPETVQTVTPSGTTINLFDYWITERSADDSALKGDAPNYGDAVIGSTGINADHQLQFTPGVGSIGDGINNWTGSSNPQSGMVKTTLVDGYPQLVANTGIGINRDESLAYLFNSTSFAGKQAFLGVSGLLQSKDGYYEYDSTQNFAAFNESTNSFDVYSSPAVYKNNQKFADGTLGQFFPFYTADQVFNSDGTPKKVDSKGRLNGNSNSREFDTNHYFGLSMSSRFIQPTDGLTNKDEHMTFEFSGDDDTWVYIDGVLVGDLGGNHSAASVKIDFATGEVSINGGSPTTLRELFEDAGASTVSFNGDTFADGTQHTLNFFYLERGNVDSNMKLKFNLVTVPQSDIIKVDQDGDAVEGAKFELYHADGSFNATGAAIATGTTDATGNLVLTSVVDNSVINFDDLYAENNSNTHYLLKETAVPSGYRTGLSETGMSMHLVYHPSTTDGGSGYITDEGETTADGFVWKNGAFTATRETLTAPGANEIYKVNGTTQGDRLENADEGLIFAVVLKQDKAANPTDVTAWHPISGTPLTGFTVGDSATMENVIAAAKTNPYVFQLNSSGQKQVEISQLPGDITKYYYIIDNKSDAEYAVGFYHTTASSLAGATEGNTTRLWGDNFTRQFSSRLYVPNIYNRLYVQKDDGAGNYLAGAEFTLYTEDSVTFNEKNPNGKFIANLTVVGSPVTTVDNMSDPDLQGAAVFENLIPGTYYLKETKAPEGYKVNEKFIKVIVDETGVYADAGTKDDGVSTSVGVGRLVKTMRQFGAQNDINSTLTYITATEQSGTETDGKLNWNDAPSPDTLNLAYGNKGAIYEYGPVDADGKVAVESDEGWTRLNITQSEHEVDDHSTHTDLGNLSLNALFSGATSVRVTDEPVAALQVAKEVTAQEGLTPNPDATFSFEFTLPVDGTYTGRIYEVDPKTGEEKLVEQADGTTEFELKNGDVVTLKDGQTVRVYGLKDGDEYSVKELSAVKEEASLFNLFGLLANEKPVMPDGFALSERLVNGKEYTPADGEDDHTISGSVVLKKDGTIDDSNKLTFVNEYTAQPAALPNEANFGIKKNLSGRNWNDQDSYTMVLQAVNYKDAEGVASADKSLVPLPEGEGYDAANHEYTAQVTKDTEDRTVTFSGLEYTKPGTYTYHLFESTPQDTIPGVSYSNALYEVTVEVIDNGSGQLLVKSVVMTQIEDDSGNSGSGEVGSIVFIDENGTPVESPKPSGTLTAEVTNTFAEKTATAPLNVTKHYNDNTGAFADAIKKFSFTLTPVSDNDVNDEATRAAMPAPGNKTFENGSLTQSAGADGTAAFGEFKFTNDKDAGHTYVYEIREVIPAGATAENDYTVDGMKYDPSVYQVTYTITLNDDGTLNVSTSWTKDGKSFTPKDNRPDFTNTYSVKEASAGLDIQKTFTGREWTENDEFGFTVTPDSKNPAKGASITVAKDSVNGNDDVDENTKDGIVRFTYGTITFTKPGTYTFTVTENSVNGAANGITGDAQSSTVKYVVSDTDEEGNHTGELTVTGPTYDNGKHTTDSDNKVTDAAAFTNHYAAAGSNGKGIMVTKTMEGKSLASYTFHITKVTADAPDVPSADASFSNGFAAENVTYEMSDKLKLNFTQADLGKTYVYKVSEDHGDDGDGYTYDFKYKGDAYVYITVKAKSGSEKDLYTVTTVVKGEGASENLTSDQLDNLVTAGATETTYVQRVDGSEADAATPTVPFVNTYTIEPLAYSALDITKSFTGTGDVSHGFSFTVTPKNTTTTDDEGHETTISTAADAGKKLDFTDTEVTNGKSFSINGLQLNGDSGKVSILPAGMEFTAADAGKTYTYEVKENAPATVPDGYTYDGTTYTVTIKVDDNGNGTLTATTTVTPSKGDAKTYVSTDSTETPVIPFANSYAYAESDLWTPQVTKKISGVGSTNKGFAFHLTADETTMAAINAGKITGTGADALKTGNGSVEKWTDGTISSDGQNVVFDGMTFTKEGTYTFTVTEGQPTEDGTMDGTALDGAAKDGTTGAWTHEGWTYDNHTVTITVEVKDVNGKLAPTATYSTENGGSVFSNTYGTSTTYGAQGGLTVEKTLEGATLKENMFSFKIEGQDGTDATADEANAKLADADKSFNNNAPSNGVSSMAKLSGVTFDQTDNGKTYVYKVTEVPGEHAAVDGGDGYTYDSTVYIVSITVHDRGKGTLYTDTVVTKEGDSEYREEYSSKDVATTAKVAFANSYKVSGSLNADGATAIEATKVLKGAEMTDGEFNFTVADKSGNVISTGTNGADGKISFDEIRYSNLPSGVDGFPEGAISLPDAVKDGVAKPGVTEDGHTSYTFTYTVSEKLAGLPDGVKPEGSTSYEITVTVIDDGDATLSFEVEYPGDDTSLTFTNVKEKSKTIGTVDKPTIDLDGKQLSVGDEYAYTIKWINNAVDADGKVAAAKVTITDTLPSGTEYVSADPDATVTGQTVTWDLGEQAANASGSVTVTVKIADDAVTYDQIENKATINIGEHSYDTDTVTNTTPKKEVTGTEADGTVKVGDVLTYTVTYKNDEASAADVTITDVIPEGTEYVANSADNEGVYADGRITWSIKNVAAGDGGTVSFKVRVTEAAVTKVENKATIKVGENGPEVNTNTVTNEVKTGALQISKTVVAEGGVAAPDADFTFTVNLKDASGNPLTGSYSYTGNTSGTLALNNGEGTITLKGGQSVTVAGLPAGAQYTVTETTVPTGFAATSGSPTSGDITADQTAEAAVTNTYTPTPATLPGSTNLKVSKTLANRGWQDGDKFTFTLTAQDNAPLPGGATGSVTVDATKDNKTPSFGDITFTSTGSYTYTITETGNPMDTNLTSSKAEYQVVVSVTDSNNDGVFEVSSVMTQVKNGEGEGVSVDKADHTAAFVNTYEERKNTKDVFEAKDPTTSVNGQLVGVGDKLTYVVNWVNDAVDENGDAAAATVTVTDVVPQGVELDAVPEDASYDETTRTLTWTIDATANQTGSVQFDVVVTDDAVEHDAIQNTATIKIGDHSSTTNTTTNTTPKKTMEPVVEGDIQVGSELTYTITWANTTGEKANVTITDELPEGLTFIKASDGGTLGENNTVTWNLGEQKPGASGSVTVKVRVNANAVKPDADNSNKATLQIGNNPAINTNTVPGPEITSGPLTISKKVVGEGAPLTTFTFDLVATAADGTPLSGEYAYTVQGGEDGTLTFEEGKATIEITDGKPITFTALPKGTLVQATEKPVAGFTASTNPLEGMVDGTDDVSLDFVNRYIGDNNNTKDVFDTKDPETSVNGKLVGVGDTLTYTINWMNDAVDANGVAAKATVVVTDKVPAGTEYVANSATEGGVYDAAARTITWTLTDQEPLAKGTLSFNVTVSEDAVNVDSIKNQAEVKVGENDPKSTTETENFVPKKEETTNPSTIKPGDILTYKITFKNTDGDGAKATVVDELAQGLTYFGTDGYDKNPQVTGATLDGYEWHVTGSKTTLTFNLKDIDADAEVTVTFKVKVTRDALSSVDNQAIVNGHNSNVVTTPVPTDNEKHVSDGSATIDGKLVSPGDVLHYSIDWANESDNESGNVEIIDTLPAGVTVDAKSISDGGALSEDGKTITWNLTGKQAGARGTVTFSVTVNDAVVKPGDVADLINTATVNDHTVSVENYIPGKEAAGEAGSGTTTGDIYVGKELTYTIAYKNTESEAATVTITDKVPEHTEFVSATDDITPAEDGTLAWTKEDVASGAEGTVSFTVRVTEDALSVDELNNTATITIGDRNTTTNTTTNQVSKGSLAISKTVSAGDTGTEVDTEQAFEFTIKLTAPDETPITGTYSYTGTNIAAGTLDFDDETGMATISLKHGQSISINDLPADVTYTVTESEVAGYTAASTGSDGTIPAGQTATAAFTNTFTPAAVTNAPVDVTKVLTGDRAPGLQAGEFSFNMSVEHADEATPVDGFQLPEDTTATNDADGKVTFGDITFTKVGTYKVTVKEQDGSDPLIDYNVGDNVYTYEVKVEKDGNALKATVQNETGSKEFTNKFTSGGDAKDVVKPSDPETSVNGQLVGVGDELTYKITWKNDAVDPETGKAATADVTVTDQVPAGTTFVEADNNGVNTDGTVTWTIKGAEPGASGTVSFTVEVNDNAVSNDPITNEATIKVGNNDPKTTNKVENDFPKKTVDGKPTVEGNVQVGDELVYTIEWANTTGEKANVTVTDALPKGLTFLEASDGGELGEKNTVTWNLGEKESGENGSVTVRVAVNEKALTESIDNKATLNIGDKQTVTTNTVPGGNPEAADGHLVIGKQVTFEAGQVNEGQAKAKSFSFTVSVTDAKGNPVTGEFAYTGQGGAESGALTLGGDGTGTVALKDGQSIEIAGLPSGAAWTVTETEVPDGYTALTPTGEDGAMVEGTELSGTIGYGQSLATAFFENHYAVEPTTLDGATNLEVTKDLQGRDWAEGDSFEFVLSADMEDEATKAAVEAGTIELPENAGGITINNATPDHKAAFGDITFKQAGTFKFYVTEQGESHDGLTYDTVGKIVTVEVTDNGDGTLTATVTDGANPTITNTYGSTGKLDTDAGALFTKSFMGKAWEDESFGFEIEAQGDAPQPENTKAEVTADSATVSEPKDGTPDMGVGPDTANATRTFGFGTINFTNANMDGATKNDDGTLTKTFTYKVWENHPADAVESTDPAGFWEANGITYDGHTATLTVTVTDDGKGNLTATPSVSKGNFSNLYEGTTVNEATLSLSGTKLLKGETGNDVALGDRTWNFSLEGADDVTKTAIENGLVVLPSETTNNADGSIDFGAITFKSAGVAATVEYQFKVVEEGVVPDVENDTAEHIIKVVVTDDGNGNLTATLAEGSEEPTITNSYTKDNTIDLGVNATKVLNGRDQKAGEFDFELATKPSGEGAAESEVVMTGATSADAADGAESAVTFEPEHLKLGFADLQQAAKDGYATYDEATKTWQLHYTVRELTDNLPAGVTAQGNTSYDVTFQVKDNGDGTLSEVGAPARYVFTNRYETGDVTVDTNPTEAAALFTKLFAGKAWGTEQFDFVIEPQDGAPEFDNATTTVTADSMAAPTGDDVDPDMGAGSANEVKAFGFGSVTITDKDMRDADGKRVFSKDFTYTVREVAPEETNGITYDSHEATLTFTVTDDGQGNLTATAPVVKDAHFSNLFESGIVDYADSVNVQIEKTLTGRDMEEGETFSFTATPADAATADRLGLDPEGTQLTTAAAADGEASVTPIFSSDGVPGLNFTQEDVNKTYAFTVSEVNDGKGGVTYDDTTYDVEIAVSQQADGKLVLTTTVTDNKGSEPQVFTHVEGAESEPVTLAFANAYDSEMPADESAKTNVSFRKIMVGRDWLDASVDSYTFELTAVTEGAPLPKDADGNDVTQLTVTKDNAGGFSFGELVFTYDMVKDEPNHAKDFVYVVREVKPESGAVPGVSYDTHTATILVRVADNGQGKLVATVQVLNDTFRNTYSSELDYTALGSLTLTKTLTGRDMMADQFSFIVTANGEDGLGIAGTYTAPAAKNGVTAVVDLLGGRTVTFTNEDANKTFSYTIVEKNDGVAGYDYDATTYDVTVHVADNNDGTLTVTTTVAASDGTTTTYTYTTGQTPEAAAVVPFENSYAAGPEYLGGSGSVALEATKTLTGRPAVAGEFGFTVTNAADGSVVATGSNAAAADGVAGAVTFSPIEYTSDSLYADAEAGRAVAGEPDENGKIAYTYQYVVTETSGVVDGVTGVVTSFSVTVTVTDNNDGTLSIEVTYPEGAGSLAFVNTYGKGADASINVNGTKVLNVPEGHGYNVPDITGKYTFTLTGSEGAPMPEKTVATNDAAGNVDFGTIHFTMENVFGGAAAEATDAENGVAPAKSEVRTKTFTYTVTEAGSVDGVTNDPVLSKTFTVTVTDNGDGTLTVTSQPATGAKFVFTNTYSAAPATLDTVVKGIKTLDGRELREGEFAFTITAITPEAPLPQRPEVTNSADGTFAFGPITFTEPGQYRYRISEVRGTLGGVTYDDTIYVLEVNVTDNGHGQLKATTALRNVYGEEVTLARFENSYEAQPTTASIIAAKVLQGAELTDGQFRFTLTDADGNVVATVANDANGNVTFGPLEFTEAGTYVYTIAEVNDGQTNVAYDGTVYKVTITVTDDGNGYLTASVSYEPDQPVFVNSYEEPEEPVEPGTPEEPEPGKPEEPGTPGTPSTPGEKPAPEIPDTGDYTNAAAPVALALAGTALVGAAWVTARRHRN